MRIPFLNWVSGPGQPTPAPPPVSGTSPAPRGADGADRDRLIDALRGASALVVVFHHLNAIVMRELIPAAHLWGYLTAFGYLGVPVFFVLSGFCIGQSWRKSSGPASFFRRRFWRIYPAYLASLVLTLGVIFVWKRLHGTNDIIALPVTPAHIVATLTLCTQPATSFTTVNWVYWSLTTEIFYYAVTGALLFWPAGRGRGWALVGLNVGLSVLALTGGDRSGTPLFFVNHWNLFALGLGVCLVVARAPEAPWFLAVSGSQMLWQIGRGQFGLSEWVGWGTLVVLLLPRERLVPGPRNPLVFLGKISYSLYLVHVPVGVFFLMHLVPSWVGSSSARFVVTQIAGTALAIAVAVFFYRYFELPFLTGLRRRPAR
jgi:peptidoglycan/LPS O-acetylase OafA/YrhL